MPHAAGDLSKEQALRYAAERGRLVTPEQFDRWRKGGLLPSPVLRGLGRGRGMQARYPEATGPQLIAAHDQLAKDRDVSAALWRLWWDGFAIEETRVVKVLERALLDAEKVRGVMQQLANDESDDLAEQFEKAALARTRNRVVGRIRRRLHKTRYATFAVLLHELTSGLYTSHDRDNAATIAGGMGVDDTPLITPDILQAMSRLFHPEPMRTALHAAKPGDITAARTELRVLLSRLLPIAVQHAGRIFGTTVDRSFSDLLADAPDDTPPLTVLLWLPLRAHPLFPVLFGTFTALLLRPLDEWIKRDIPTLIGTV